MDVELLYFLVGVLMSSVTFWTIFLFRKDKLINKEVQKELGVLEECDLQSKIYKLIEMNGGEFSDIIFDGVEIIFDPTLDGPNCNDRVIIPRNIEEFFNEIAEELIEDQEYWW